MSDIPTPQTDAQVSVGLENADRECVPAEFARRLERERDEAREQRDIAWGKLHRVLKLLDAYDDAIKNPSNPFWGAFKKLFTWEAAK